MELELDLDSERRLYEAGIRPSAEIGLLLLSCLERAEQAVQRVRVELGYIPEDFSARILRALDGDTRRLADDALGGEQHG